ELAHARAVAHQFGTQHAEEIATPDAASLLEEIVHYFDEPFADSSAIPTYMVCRMASRRVKVVLTGDGGDEAFGGYSRYAHDLKEAAVRDRLPRWFRRGVLGPAAGVWPQAAWLPRRLRAKSALTNLALDPAAAHAHSIPRRRDEVGVQAGLPHRPAGGRPRPAQARVRRADRRLAPRSAAGAVPRHGARPGRGRPRPDRPGRGGPPLRSARQGGGRTGAGALVGASVGRMGRAVPHPRSQVSRPLSFLSPSDSHPGE